jgi:hypothetical protein
VWTILNVIHCVVSKLVCCDFSELCGIITWLDFTFLLSTLPYSVLLYTNSAYIYVGFFVT